MTHQSLFRVGLFALMGCFAACDSSGSGRIAPDGGGDACADSEGDAETASDGQTGSDGRTGSDGQTDGAGERDAAPLTTASTVTKDDITWTLDGDYSVGQFITGDWFVVAPSGVQVVGISTSGSEELGGSMKNPAPNAQQGYWPKGGYQLTYNPDLNVGLGLPVALEAGDKLVSTTLYPYFEQTSPTGQKNLTAIEQAAILTVLASAPPAGSFRPGLCDLENVIYNAADIDYSLLKRLTPTSKVPTLAKVADSVARPWLDHYRGWPGRAIHPNHNMRDYGAELAVDVSTAALMVNSDFTDLEKRPIVIGLVQVGLDFYSHIKRTPRFYSHQPGHISGRKFPVMFAGNLLNVAEIKAIWPYTGAHLHETWGSYPDDARVFAEDGMHAYVTAQDVVETAKASDYLPDHDYTSAMIGMPEWFHRDYVWRRKDNSSWSADPYRRAGSSAALEGVAIAVYAMGWKDQWNHQAFFDYMDRYVAIAKGQPDPFGFEVHGEKPGGRGIYGSGWCVEMWNRYRDAY